MSARLPLQSKALRPKFENKRAVFGDDEDEEDKVIDERVVGIEDNKVKEAEPKKEKAPLVISPLPNVDFRANAKHKKELYIPAGAQQQQQVGENKPEILDQPAAYGLQIQNKKVVETKEDNTVTTVEETTTTTTTTTTTVKIPAVEETPKTLEERAVEALIRESRGEVDEEEDQGPKKVIPAAETLAFRDDYEKRPEETTMDDYERVPVDEFGAALLRGLGWNEGEGIGRNRKNAPAPPPTEVKQRDALLGLGAKPHQVEFKNDKETSQHRREQYVYKDTSLFKKLSKRKLEEDDRSSSRRRDDSRSSSSSSKRRDDDSRSSSSRRRDDDRKRRRSRSRDSDRRRRSRSRSPVSRSSSSSSKRRSRSRSPRSRRDRR